MKNNIDLCANNFINYIIGNEPNENYISYATKHKEEIIGFGINGKGDLKKIRPMLYKLYLRIFPIEKGIDFWIDQQNKLIDDYNKIKKEIFEKINEEEKIELKQNENDKENNKEDNNIDNKKLSNEKLKHIINIDIDRVFQENELFHEEKIKKILYNVLIIYSKLHEETTSYKQGMHEILSMFIFVLYPYYFEYNNKKTKEELLEIYSLQLKRDYLKSLYLFFHNENNLECDLYYLFSSFMEKSITDFYNNEKRIERCKYIIEKELSVIDKELYAHITKIDLSYIIFMERWLKCIFNREFSVENCLILWDVIIANNIIDYFNQTKRLYDMMFIDFICIGIFEYFKTEILLKDFDECLILLNKFPYVPKIFDLIRLAEDKKQIYYDIINKKEKSKLNDINNKKKKLIPNGHYDNFLYELGYKKNSSLKDLLNNAGANIKKNFSINKDNIQLYKIEIEAKENRKKKSIWNICSNQNNDNNEMFKDKKCEICQMNILKISYLFSKYKNKFDNENDINEFEKAINHLKDEFNIDI